MSETRHAQRSSAPATSTGPALQGASTFTPAQQLYLARKVARKAVSLSAMAQGLEAGGAQAGDQLEQQDATPADVAARGFGGKGHAIPHQAQMEQSFGMGFGHVTAYTDANARQANDQLGANAYAMNDKIAFRESNPSPELVAHELTHVLQHTGTGPARKATGGGADGGIDVDGEGEAEAVEAAVKSGKPALSVWDGAGAGTAAGGDIKAAGPARKGSGKGPALDSRFTMGMAFSPSGFEKSYEYSLWDAPAFRVPIAAVPGLNAIVEPSVKVKAGGGVDWTQSALKANVGLQGGVLFGFEYGNKDVVGLYGGLECSVAGGFEYTKSPDSWSLEGTIKLSSNFTIGCKVAGGILDYKFDFGKVDPICQFAGIKWEKGKPFQAGLFSWGPQVLEFFAAVRRTVQRAQELVRAGAEAARAAYDAAARTAQGAYNTGRDVVNWVTSW